MVTRGETRGRPVETRSKINIRMSIRMNIRIVRITRVMSIAEMMRIGMKMMRG